MEASCLLRSEEMSPLYPLVKAGSSVSVKLSSIAASLPMSMETLGSPGGPKVWG